MAANPGILDLNVSEALNPTTHSDLSHLSYRPDIDGLRAIAVLSVLAFHAFPKIFYGGFIGVDIFFVISGYLISTIIFKDLESGNFTFRRFYERRIRRIFPALITVLVSCLITGWFILLTDEFRQLGKHIAAGSGFVSNLILWNESGYFDLASDVKPLLHLWSLGIEEQFYIVWPLLAWLGWKSKHRMLLIIISILLTSFSLNIHGIISNPNATFYSPVTRFWELSVGSLLAYYALYRKPSVLGYPVWHSSFLSVTGILLILIALVSTTKDHAFPGWYALMPVLGTVLLISAGNQCWFNRTILSHKALVWIGLVSFPLYLWHWPLLSYARVIETETPDRFVRVTLVITSFILAFLTHRFIEKPLRFGKRRRQSVFGLACVMCLVGVLGIGVSRIDSMADTRLSSRVDPEIIKAMSDWEFPDGLKKHHISGIDIYVNQSANPEVVLLGDSHIEQYGPRVVELTKRSSAKNVAFVTAAGCPPIPKVYDDLHPKCHSFIEDFQKFLTEHRSVRTILIAACWNCYFINEIADADATSGTKRYDYYFKDEEQVEKFRGGAGREKSLAELAKYVKSLRSANYDVHVLLDNPTGKQFAPEAILGQDRKSLTFDRGSRTNLQVAQKTFDRDVKQVLLEEEMTKILGDTGITLHAQSESICPRNICSPVDSFGKPIFSDSDHIRPFYIREKMDVIDSVISR